MHRIVRVVAAALLVLAPVVTTAQEEPNQADLAAADAARTAMRDGRYLDAANILRAVAFDAAGRARDGLTYRGWAEADARMTGEQPPPADTANKPVEAGDIARLRSATLRDAIAEIVARARRTRIVILNEDHGVPRDRAFALEVARALHPLGYHALAIETLNNVAADKDAADTMRTLAAARYPRRSTGYYTADPVFGDFLRQSLKLGYRPVAYETTDFSQTGDADQQIARREQAQADHLVARVLRDRPAAKLFVYVGFSHATEAPQDRDGHPTRWLATRLKAMTGIDPLTIDQVTVAEHPSYGGSGRYALLAGRIDGVRSC